MQITGAYIIFTFLAVLAIILFAIMIYRSVYKRNINRALDGIHQTRLIEPFSFFQVIIMIATVVLVILSYSELKTIETYLVNLETKLTNVETRLNYINGQVSGLSGLFDQFYQDQKWVQMATYDFHDYDQTTETIATEISFSLKESDLGALVYVVATNQSDVSDFIKVLVDSTTLSYVANIDLDIDKIYNISVLSENGTELQSEQILRIDLTDLFGPKIRVSGSISADEFEVELHLDGIFTNFGIDNYTIVTAELILYYENGTVHSVVDILPFQNNSGFNTMYFDYETVITDKTVFGYYVRFVDSFGNVFEEPKYDFDRR